MRNKKKMNSLNCRRDTTCEWKKQKLQSSTYRLHTFLRMLGIFYDKLGKQNQQKKIKPKKKKKLNHIDCKIAYESMTI